jgi:hypothetical protein
MDKLAKQLIKLGHTSPELRPHLKAILKNLDLQEPYTQPVSDKIAGGPIEPLGYDLSGRPMYLPEQVFGKNSYVRDLQKRSIDQKYNLAIRHATNGSLAEAAGKLLRIKLEGIFEVEPESTRGAVIDEGDEDGQAWARLVLKLPNTNKKLRRVRTSTLDVMIAQTYSVSKVCRAQLDDLSEHNGDLYLEISWWGAIWEEDVVSYHREKMERWRREKEEKERRRLEQERAREEARQKAREEEERRKKDPAYIRGQIMSELEYALKSLDSGRGRYVSSPTLEGSFIYGSYRSNLDEDGSEYDDYYEDEDGDDPGESNSYEEAVSFEEARAEERIMNYLKEYEKHIKGVFVEQGDKNYMEVTVTLK